MRQAIISSTDNPVKWRRCASTGPNEYTQWGMNKMADIVHMAFCNFLTEII